MKKINKKTKGKSRTKIKVKAKIKNKGKKLLKLLTPKRKKTSARKNTAKIKKKIKSKVTAKKIIVPKKKMTTTTTTAIKSVPVATKKSTITTTLAIKPVIKKTTAISGPMGVKPYTPTKNEFYMSPKQIEHFKAILNIWKEQLMSEMNRTVQHMKNDAANFPDPVDRASQEEEFNLELKTRERERKLIKKIDEALEKIQGGDYGFCADCGAEIGIKRLEARPTASQCIECKTIAEIREKQIGG
jgi:DnaK suppressor protein